MTLVENLQSKNITVKPKRGKPPREELKRLYPVVNDMFDEITQAVNLGYAWSCIGAEVIDRMAGATGSCAGFWTMNRSCFPMR